MSGLVRSIEIRRATKVYSGVPALYDLDLNVEPGELCFVVGPSGAGKSTLLRLLAGIETPSRGTVKILGQDPATLGRDALADLRRRMGIVFQDLHLLADRTAAENVALPLQLRGEPGGSVDEWVRQTLDLVGLTGRAHVRASALSGGERQRVAIARALTGAPSLVLADEPTGDLDPQQGQRIFALFEAINRMGTTVVLVTHNPSLLSRGGHRTIGLVSGRKVIDGVVETYPSTSLRVGDMVIRAQPTPAGGAR